VVLLEFSLFDNSPILEKSVKSETVSKITLRQKYLKLSKIENERKMQNTPILDIVE